MYAESNLRIGISMRVSEAKTYKESRDAIAQDWSNLLLTQFPEASWVYIPNIQKKAEDFCCRWNLNGFILSGGDDLGLSKERDSTEETILQYALKNTFPVLGVCRGLQLIYRHFGGALKKGNQNFIDTHCASFHWIKFGQQKVLVNSYHQNTLEMNTMPSNLQTAAFCENDGSIEAIKGNNLLGIMWHPERSLPSNTWNHNLMKDFFNL
jgi:N5-(cytidine 5'-diphosphoramidyl)-L-glutamine hydrolase